MSCYRRAGVALVILSFTAFQSFAAEELQNTTSTRVPVEYADEVTLVQALELALLRNPDLSASAWEVKAREARIVQAGAWPNPELQMAVEQLGTSLGGPIGGEETTIQLGQLVELGGKRPARVQFASVERDLAGWDFEINRTNLLSRVADAFIEVLSAQQQVALAEETVRLSEQIVAAVSARVQGGKASPVEETKSIVALATTKIRLDRTKRELAAARKTLSSTWGSPEPHFTTAKGDLYSIPAVPELDQIMNRLNLNPELALRASMVSLHQAKVDLEKAARIPDLTLGGGYRQHTVPIGQDDDSFLIEVSIPLPLFNRNRGGIDAARYREMKSKEEHEAAKNSMEIALAQSHSALSTAYSRVLSLRETVLPGAQSAFEAVNEGYRLGRFGLLDVLDSQRTLFSARDEYLRAATDYHKAATDVERQVGNFGDLP